jgi:hypothetical protein
MTTPILVTGSHRSGTTWVGQMIAASGLVHYVHEPFHIAFSARGKIDKWFQYIYPGWENEAAAKMYLDQKFFLKFPEILRRIKKFEHLDDLWLLINDVKLSIQGKAPLVKDPIALFSVEWIAQNFNTKNIFTIRHPAAFVGSLKVAAWHFPFKDLLDQPKLMEQMPDYKDLIAQYAETPPDIIEQGILLWKIFHHQILDSATRYQNWYFVKHEDLSLNPDVEFKKIMDYLGLEYNAAMQQAVKVSTTAEEAARTQRDSKENILTWKERLSPEEIQRIKQGVEPVGSKLYGENEW